MCGGCACTLCVNAFQFQSSVSHKEVPPHIGNVNSVGFSANLEAAKGDSSKKNRTGEGPDQVGKV